MEHRYISSEGKIDFNHRAVNVEGTRPINNMAKWIGTDVDSRFALVNSNRTFVKRRHVDAILLNKE